MTTPHAPTPTAPPEPADTPSALAPAGFAAARAPLWAVLLFTGWNSFATGTTFNGIFFITQDVFAFQRPGNFALALLVGVMYIAGALATGPILRRLRAALPFMSSRAMIAAFMVAAAALNLLPLAAWTFAGQADSVWSIWLFIALYAPLCGALWPIVESYLSGGRRGAVLRTAMGRFNMTWSVALVGSLMATDVLAFDNQLTTLVVMSAVHLATMLLLIPMGREPGRHEHDDAHPVPATYPRLLAVHRVLLPMAYMVMYALNPLGPSLMAGLGVAERVAGTVFALWCASRVATFALLERWHGWHGTWITASGGTATLLGGFGLVVLADRLAGGPGPIAVALGLAGLFLFGVGIAAIYCGALYYALEVGSAQVEAGGMHEALIGVGYTVGPLCGLASVAAASGALIDPENQDPLTLILVTILAGGAVAFALRAPSAPAGPAENPGRP